jgi:hypothetical protein
MRVIGWVIGIALFVWAIFSAFSLLSRLGFLVDGLSWSANHAPLTVKAIASESGAYVSQLVIGYRALVHELVQILHLPRLPQFVYDTAGVVAFSIGRGLAISRKIDAAFDKIMFVPGAPAPNYEQAYYLYPIKRFSLFLSRWLWTPVLRSIVNARRRDFRWIIPYLNLVTDAFVYGGLVAVLVAALFGIDYLYRHYA